MPSAEQHPDGDATPLRRPAKISTEQWSRLEPVLDALLDAAPEERPALLDSLSAGDAGVRRELDALLTECERELPIITGQATERFAALCDETGVAFPQGLTDRYEPRGALARGGMAAVFKARDLKHGRDVAVKVVHPAFIGALGREHFLREIAIAAHLHHPHIVPLYDSGETDGFLYYIMPYVEGRSLRDRLSREGPLPIAEARSVLRDVCDALTHAHSHGIVHRDIKPDNVLLTGHHALVTDFGVAKALTEATAQDGDTAAGVVLGTPTYMAPEQISGAGVDDRADIYAFGCLAYELLTGRPPFTGQSRAEILAGHLHRHARPVTELRSEISAELSALVMRCLEKRPDDRWQRSVELLDALTKPVTAGRPLKRWLAGATIVAAGLVWAVLTMLPPSGPRRASQLSILSHPSLSIGVLPVRAASARGELEWVAQGLANQLPAALTTVAGLDVRPPESFTPLTGPLDSVALERGINFFVRAALTRGRLDTVVVTVELIEEGIRLARAGDVRAPLDSQSTVDNLTSQIVETLRPMLGGRVRERQLEAGTTSPVALQQRYRADHHRAELRARITGGDTSGAIAALNLAEASLIASERADSAWLAPRVARAALTGARALLVLFRPGPTDHGAIRRIYDRGIAILDSALMLHPRDPATLAMRGRLRWERVVIGEAYPLSATAMTSAAEADLRSALAADTTLAQAAADLSQLLFEARGRYDEAARLAEQAYRLDAYMEKTSEILDRLALSKLETGDDSAALRWCAEGLRRFPQNPAHRGCFLDVLAWGTRASSPDSALAHYKEIEQRLGTRNVSAFAHYLVDVAAVLARDSAPGSADSARRVLARAKAAVPSTAHPGLRDELLALEAAVLYRLGDRGRADSLFAEFRLRDSLRAERLAERRMLRGYVDRRR